MYFSRIRWSFIFGLIFLYCFAHFLHNHSKDSWLPEPILDSTLKKKTADGPLILRDDIFDNGGGKKNGRVIHGAAVLQGNLDGQIFVDAPIISKVTESPPKNIEISEKFLKKFRSIAKKVSNSSTDDFILFSVINHAYFNLTSNFLCNLYALNEKLHTKIFIVSLQEETCKKLKKDWPKIHCHWLESDKQHNLDTDWGKKVYVQILTFRARLLEELAKLNIEFILFESDSIWIKEPFELIKNATTIDDVDILIPINGYTQKQKFAFDPLVAFNTQARTDLFIEMRNHLEKDPTLMDQEVLNDLCSSQFKGVICRNFEWHEIADGKWFKMGERERKEYKPYIINNNYYVGVKNKSARQALNGLWFLSPKGNCNVSKAKKQLAKYQK